MARVIEKKPAKNKRVSKLKIKPAVVYGVICFLLVVGLVFAILYRVGAFEKNDKVVKKFTEYNGIQISYDSSDNGLKFGEEHTDEDGSYYLFEPGDFLLVFNSDYRVYEDTLIETCLNGTNGGFNLETSLKSLFEWLNLDENSDRTLYIIDTSRKANEKANATLILGNYTETENDDAERLVINNKAFSLVYYNPSSADGGYKVYDFSVSGTISEFKTEILEMIK